MYIQHGRVKDDSVLYLEVAKHFTQGQWAEGLALYKWPFYSFLIASLHNISTLPLLICAQVLQVLFFAVFTYSFMRLIKLAGGDIVTISIGGLLIFSSANIVGISLELLVRDFGFYAFLFFSVGHLIEYSRHSKVTDSLKWQLSMIVATLFRIEATLYLMVLPLSLLVLKTPTTTRQNIQKYLNANTIIFAIIALLIATSLVKNDLFLGKFNDVLDAFGSGIDVINNNLQLKADIINDQILGKYLNQFGMLSITVTLALITLIKLSSVAGLVPVVGLLANKNCAVKTPNPDVQKLLILVAFLTSISALYIIFYNYVLESRYILPFGIVIIFFATFSLQDFFKNQPAKTKKITLAKTLLLIFIALLTVYNLYKNVAIKRADYNYDQDAVAWIDSHKNPREKVFYNSERLKYYAGAPFYKHGFDDYQYIHDSIIDNSILMYDYLALSISQSQVNDIKTLFLTMPRYMLVQEISGYAGKKRILIYKKQANSTQP
ncbi:MAG TPA: hypothetical protein PL131_09220 [Methylotenera sp.]|nr:hypothetical protein [Methylotenera sp.]HPH06042.1 hypothetical protein [Methylotenera sp.]HPN00620.1 hypothetical protein [Methylotenera sp.]